LTLFFDKIRQPIPAFFSLFSCLFKHLHFFSFSRRKFDVACPRDCAMFMPQRPALSTRERNFSNETSPPRANTEASEKPQKIVVVPGFDFC
jgi:hypothetical protein